MKTVDFKNIGKQLFAIAGDASMDSIKRAEGFVEELFRTQEGVKKVAHILDTAAEAEGVPAYDIFRVLNSKVASGDFEVNTASKTLVAESLDLFYAKKAKGLLPGLGLIGGATSSLADIAKTTWLLSAAGGAALGSGYWLLNNKMDEDSPDGQTRVGLEQRLRQYEKAIGNVQRKNIKTKAQRVKATLLQKVRANRAGGNYEELT